MKKNLLAMLCLLATTHLYAQKFEVSVQANTGLSRFAGLSTTNTSFINQGPNNHGNYINNPYSNTNAASYGFGLQTQFVTKSGFILGVQAGYEALKSKVNLTRVSPLYTSLIYTDYYYPENYTVITPSATGNGFFENKFINLNPFIGYRIQQHQIKVDIMPGVDIGFHLNAYDKGKATAIADGTVYEINYKRSGIQNDIRLRMGLAAYYNRFGLTASYASGLTNYQKDLISGKPYDASSKVFRLGVSYRIY